ncbi:hypothetical protein Btru_036016 [Bulinus truncatus]|nr:hypothetical protein Btru_036016 [Bulinus truncatus]
MEWCHNTLGLSGVSDTVGLSGVSDTVGLSGVSDTVGLSGVSDTVGLSGVNRTVYISGLNNAIGLSAVSNSVGLSGVNNTVGLRYLTLAGRSIGYLTLAGRSIGYLTLASRSIGYLTLAGRSIRYLTLAGRSIGYLTLAGRSIGYLTLAGRSIGYLTLAGRSIGYLTLVGRSIRYLTLNFTVADWRQFCENPLPCFGLVEAVKDFVPFTGRASAPERTESSVQSQSTRLVHNTESNAEICSALNCESNTVKDESLREPHHNQALRTSAILMSHNLSPSAMSSCNREPSSLFIVSPHDAAAMVKDSQKEDKSRHCYLLHLKLQPLYSDEVIPGSALRKLPRLLNRIPLGAGFLSNDQVKGINWRLVEGSTASPTFISCPLLLEEAEDDKNCLKERLTKQAGAVFGDVTVKASLSLSRCIDLSLDFVLNDIAVVNGEGLHFRD